MTKIEERIVAKALELAAPFTPTTIGMELGYAQVRASSKVAPALKLLVEKGRLIRTQTGHKKVTYALAG